MKMVLTSWSEAEGECGENTHQERRKNKETKINNKKEEERKKSLELKRKANEEKKRRLCLEAGIEQRESTKMAPTGLHPQIAYQQAPKCVLNQMPAPQADIPKKQASSSQSLDAPPLPLLPWASDR